MICGPLIYTKSNVEYVRMNIECHISNNKLHALNIAPIYANVNNKALSKYNKYKYIDYCAKFRYYMCKTWHDSSNTYTIYNYLGSLVRTPEVKSRVLKNKYGRNDSDIRGGDCYLVNSEYNGYHSYASYQIPASYEIPASNIPGFERIGIDIGTILVQKKMSNALKLEDFSIPITILENLWYGTLQNDFELYNLGLIMLNSYLVQTLKYKSKKYFIHKKWQIKNFDVPSISYKT